MTHVMPFSHYSRAASAMMSCQSLLLHLPHCWGRETGGAGVLLWGGEGDGLGTRCLYVCVLCVMPSGNVFDTVSV